MSYSALSATPPHAEDIKALLRKRFGSLAAVAKQLGVGPASISGVINNPLNSQKLEKRMAGLLHLPPAALWPDRWTASGEPIPRKVRRAAVLSRSPGSAK